MKLIAVTQRAPFTQKIEVLAIVAYGLTGWALCAATMGIGMSLTTIHAALIIHAIAAPLIVTLVSFLYFRRQNAWSPLRTASAFLAIVAALDFVIVALAIQHSFAMFASVLGVWLPFLLIFLASWLTGLVLQRRTLRA